MTAVALLAAGLVVVVVGADLLLDGVVGVAARLGISAFVITVLLSGMELENLAAGIAANAKGLPGAAAGTFLGGTTFVAIAVTGAAGLIAPIRAAMPARALLWTAAAPLPLLALSLDGRLSRADGAILLVWFAVALIGLIRARPPAGTKGTDPPARSRRFGAARLVGGLALLTGGGVMLGEGIRRVVSDLGVSQTLLGNTAIAASVEAEEVARVAVPSRRGRGDLAVANLLATAVHFVAFNAGLIALIRPLPLDSATRHLHLPVAVASCLVLAGVLGLRARVGRVEGALLLLAYAGYVAVSIVVGVG